MIENPKPSTKIAAIDIGSNSVHLAITEVNGDGRFKVLDSHKEVIRLASHLDENRRINREGFERTIQALLNMRALAGPYRPKFVAVATQATRAATNHEEFVKEVSQQTGIPIRIINGEEEARLTFLGVRYGLMVDDRVCLELDIGGGSTEILIGQKSETPFVISLPLGTVSLSKRFFNFKNLKKNDYEKLREHVENELKPLRDKIKNLNFDYAVATSGTAKALATIDYRRHFGGSERAPNGYAFQSKEVHKNLNDFLKLSSPTKIAAKYDVDEQRSEIIVAGSVIIDVVSDLFKVKTWHFCSYGLREGLAIDSYLGAQSLEETTPVKARQTSIEHLGKKFDIDVSHALNVQTLTLSFFEQLQPYILRRADFSHETVDNTDILRIASYLSEIGWYISPNRPHRHSYYILANSSLEGFRDEIKNLSALVIRYSKKGVDTDDEDLHDPFLNRNQKRVNLLATCLMVGKALNRTRSQVVKKIAVDLTGSTIRIVGEYAGDFPRLEQAQFLKIAPQVAKCFGKPVSLHLKELGR